jgi:hypothetical protein
VTWTGGTEGEVHKQPRWSPGQRILNDTGARMPGHTLDPPVPVVARIVWEDDGEEYIETVAAGWTGRNVYVRSTITTCAASEAGIAAAVRARTNELDADERRR